MTTTFSLAGKRVLVTGGNGFLGRHLCEALEKEGADVVIPCRHLPPPQKVDLRQWSDVQGMFSNACRGKDIDVVFHLAGWNGGVVWNEMFPASIFFDNTLMGLNVLEAARQVGVGKVVSVIASCGYPALELVEEPGQEENAENPICFFDLRQTCAEDEYLDGPIDPSVECHGYAKRNLLLASRFYNQQYGTRFHCVCPTTLYGPGDTTNPERAKVVGGMVMRFLEAKRENAPFVECWGDGTPLRELLYVKDCAAMLVRSVQFERDLVNLGSGTELSIRELAEAVARQVGYAGEIRWDTSRPTGQQRKRLDLTLMTKELGEFPLTPFDEALAETVKYYAEAMPFPADEEQTA